MQMNLKLHHLVNDVMGKTGRLIIDAILAGERDPKTLAAFRDRRCKNDESVIAGRVPLRGVKPEARIP